MEKSRNEFKYKIQYANKKIGNKDVNKIRNKNQRNFTS